MFNRNIYMAQNKIDMWHNNHAPLTLLYDLSDVAIIALDYCEFVCSI